VPYVFGVGDWNAVGSNQRSTVGSSSRPSPMRSGHDGAPLLTPVLRKTVNGRPVESVTMPLNCQFSRIGFRKPAVGDRVLRRTAAPPSSARSGA
jgi:hypothetical protein